MDRGLGAEIAPPLRPLDVIGPYVVRFLQAGASEAADPSIESGGGPVRPTLH